MCAAAAASVSASGFSDGRIGFAVSVGEVVSDYSVLGVFVLPRETLSISVIDPPRGRTFTLDADGGSLTSRSATSWSWLAPEDPGHYPIEVGRTDTEDAMRLNIFVLVPFETLQGDRLEGYRIGSYPSHVLKGREAYRPPKGFVRVTPEVKHTPVSPHFTLGQFLCKQESDFPKWVVLREQLLLELEHLLELANASGHRSSSFVVMSGYRTPFYNAAIGNVKYSRHQWGDAADIYIDEDPQDGVMDDLNGDGRIDESDAEVLRDLIDSDFEGGLATYGSTAAHGPFVHIDVRGYRARW